MRAGSIIKRLDYRVKLLLSFSFLISFFSLFWELRNHGWRDVFWPAIEAVPLTLRLLDSDYLRNDFFVNAHVGTPKEIFSYIIALVMKITNMDWWGVLFFVKMLLAGGTSSLFLLNIAGVLKIERGQLPVFGTSFFIGIILYSYYSNSSLNIFFISTYSPIFLEPTAHTLSLLLALLGGSFFMNKSVLIQLTASTLIFMSTLIHPVVGICFSLFYSCLIVSTERSWKSKFLSLLIILASSLVAAISIKIVYGESSSLALDRLIQIYIIERHPHHFHMPYIWKKEWYKYCLIAIFLILPTAYFYIKKYRTGFYLGTMFLLSFFVSNLAQYFFINIVPMESVVLFGPSRYNIFLFWMVMTLWSLLFSKIIKYYSLNEKIIDKGFIITLILTLLLFIWIPSIFKNPILNKSEEERAVISWIKENTSKDSVLQVARVDKQQIDTFDIRIHSKRAIMGDRGFTFNQKYIEEWYQRYKAVTFIDSKLQVDSNFQFDYLIVSSSSNLQINCKLLFRRGDHFIYDWKSCL